MEEKKNGLSLASFICGIVSFLGCCNPFYLVSLAGFILGIVALFNKNTGSKWMGVVGIILSILAVVIWVIIDILLLPFTFGASFLI